MKEVIETLKQATYKVGKNADPKALSVERAYAFLRRGKVVGLLGVVKNPQGEYHLPMVYLKEGNVSFYCGEAPADEDIRKAVYDLWTSNQLPSPAYCWRKEGKSRKEGCKHALALLHYLENGGAVEVVELAKQEASQEASFEMRLRSLAFKTHLLLLGEAGSGKTHLAFSLARWAKAQFGARTFILQGGPHVEAVDLLGRYIKKGDIVEWEDGVLSKAFKLARKGRVVVVVDELPRIPTREQGLLIAPLYPISFTTKGDWFYLTNPLNGEELWVPASNLWVIATGNIGLGFSHSSLSDNALAERFMMFHLQTTPEQIERVLKPLISAKGWDAEKLLPAFLKMREVGEEFVERGELSAPPSLRVFKRAVELAPTQEELEWFLIHSFPSSSREEQELWAEAVRKVLSD
ncbi:MAG: AAA family ATPase [Aquificaceae bacterium]